jgi:ubiquinone/menaquinone biosynthesis C-methylase UbiE
MKKTIQQSVQKQFGKRAAGYNTYTSWLKSKSLFDAIIFPLKDLIPNAYCLDIGGGTGYVPTEDVKISDRNWVVCDLSSEMGSHIQRSERVTFTQGNAHNLPFENDTFHFILIRSMLYYVNIDKVLKEAYRVLKVGGYLVIAEKIFNKRHIHFDDFKRLVNLRNPLKINIPKTDDIKNALLNNKFEFITLKRIEETYTQNLDIYLSRNNTAPVENQKEVMNILQKFADSNLGIKLNDDNTFTFQLNWEIFYAKKDIYLPNQTPIVVSMIVERKIAGKKHILLQKRKAILKEPEYYNYWELPQGKVESGENIKTAVKRELKEETNLIFKSFKSTFDQTTLGNNHIETFETNNCVSIFGKLNFISLCLIISASGTPYSSVIDSEPQWINIADIDSILREKKVFPLNIPMLRQYLRNNL